MDLERLKENQNMNQLKENLRKARTLGRDVTLLYSLDVECVQVEPGNKKAPAHVALVDSSGRVAFNEYIRPKEKIVSYDTEYSGVTKENLRYAKSFGDVRSQLLLALPKNAIIVGQAIENDLTWMKLKKGVDFADSYDISDLFKLSRGNETDKFSLSHLVKYLSGFKESGKDIQIGSHNPVTDANFSLRIFLRFHNSTMDEILHCQKTLLDARS